MLRTSATAGTFVCGRRFRVRAAELARFFPESGRRRNALPPHFLLLDACLLEGDVDLNLTDLDDELLEFLE